VSAVTYFILP